MKKIFITLMILTLSLGGLASALRDSSPVDSVLIPNSQALYFADHSINEIAPYTRDISGWTKYTPPIYLNVGETCQGLAAAADGSTLFMSIANGSNSEIRSYQLDNQGLPTAGAVVMGGDYWGSNSIPAGLAIGGRNLFTVDRYYGFLRAYNISTATMEVEDKKFLGTQNLFNVAAIKTGQVTYGYFTINMPPFGPTQIPQTYSIYTLYVSHKAQAGAIYVYEYSENDPNTTPTLTYQSTLNDSVLEYPTYLKIVGTKLYAAINGTQGVDIAVYDVTSNLLVGTVKNSNKITGDFGWTSFAFTSDNKSLYYKKAKTAAEKDGDSELFMIDLDKITMNAEAEDVTPTTASNPAFGGLIGSDGLTIASDTVALTNSPDGKIQIIPRPVKADITVTAPNGGEKWKIGSDQSITWTTSGEVAYASIEVSVDNGTNWSLITTEGILGGSSSYTWTVPNTPTTDALIRVSDAKDGKPFDVSDATFEITTEGAATGVVVSNTAIARSSKDVVITWQTTPADKPCYVWTASPYSTDPADWTKLTTSAKINTHTDTDQVGKGTTKYYRAAPEAQTSLTAADITTEVVGKVDIHIDGGKMTLMSLPLIPSSTTISDVIGDQLTAGYDESNSGAIYNDNKGTWNIAFYQTSNNKWTDSVTYQDSTLETKIDKGYIVTNPSTVEITVVGKIPTTERSITIEKGLNLIGSAYPLATAIASAGLDTSGCTAGYDESNSGAIYNDNKGTWNIAFYQTSNNKWTDSVTYLDSTLKLEPGKGYWFFEPTKTSFTWKYPKPY